MERNRIITNNLLMLTISLVVVLAGCKSNDKEDSRITILLEDSVNYEFLNRKKASFRFLSEDSLTEEIKFLSDTLFTQFSLKADGDWTELVYSENGQANFSYFVQKGDNVVLKFKNNKPWMVVVNRTTKEYDGNWERLRNQEFYERERTHLEEFEFLWNASLDTLIPVDLSSELRLYKEKAMRELEKERYLLDSLVNNDLLSTVYSEFYKERNQFEKDKLKFFDVDKGAFDVFHATQEFLHDTSFDKHDVYLDEYSDFLLSLLMLQYPTDTRKIIENAQNEYFSQVMIYKFLNRKFQELSFAEIDQIVANESTTLPNEWLRKLVIPFNKKANQVPDMDLKGFGEERLSFQDLLSEKRGYYLYVDLWAAWCLPCIRAFPSVKELQSEYQDKRIQVIYLSVDPNHKFWDQVVQKYDVAIADQSYIVMNLKESEYLNELNMSFIPRYILFDSQGNLIHPNAPRPESREIRVLLDSLISE